MSEKPSQAEETLPPPGTTDQHLAHPEPCPRCGTQTHELLRITERGAGWLCRSCFMPERKAMLRAAREEKKRSAA